MSPKRFRFVMAAVIALQVAGLLLLTLACLRVERGEGEWAILSDGSTEFRWIERESRP